MHDLPLAQAPVLGSQEIPGGQCSQPGTGNGVTSAEEKWKRDSINYH